MKNAVDHHVGQRIRHQRLLRGMTQQQLAHRVGVRFQQIQKYETGTNRVSASRLWARADVLGVPVSFFFAGLPAPDGAAGGTAGGGPGGAPDQDGLVLDPKGARLVRAYQALPEAMQRQLFDLLTTLEEAHGGRRP